MTLSELGRKYYVDESLNCAQAVFLAVNEKYNLGYTKLDAQLMSGFGGGMGCGDTCGALTGGFAILGKLILKENEMKSEELKATIENFRNEFRIICKSTYCKDLEPIYKIAPPVSCAKTVMIACEVLEKILEKR
ncbi:MAG: C-GCAxxG-C-C family protein [Clostridia bacterium]